MRGEQLDLPGVAMGKKKLCRLTEPERVVLVAAVEEYMRSNGERHWKNVPELVEEIIPILPKYCEAYRVPLFEITGFNIKTVLESLDVKCRPEGRLFSAQVTSLRKRRYTAKVRKAKMLDVLNANPMSLETLQQMIELMVQKEVKRQLAGRA